MMKKMFLLMIVALLTCTSAWAQGTVTVGSATGDPGTDITIQVTIDDQAPAIRGAQIQIGFDKDNLTFKSGAAVDGTWLISQVTEKTPDASNGQNGQVEILLAGSPGALPAGTAATFAEITFTIAGTATAGDYSLEYLSTSSVADDSNNPITLTGSVDGTITVTGTITYTLNVTATGGTVAKNPDQATYNDGDTVELTATPNAGCTFTGWSGDLSGSTSPATITMDGNKNVTASFDCPPAYTLTITATGGTVAKNPDQSTYADGDTVELTATPDANCTFTGWSGDLSGATNPATITMDADKAVTASFDCPPTGYTLDITATNGTVTKNPDQAEYQDGDTVVITATPDAGYDFSGWFGDAMGTISPKTITMNSNKTIQAIFTDSANPCNIVPEIYKAPSASDVTYSLSDQPPYCDSDNITITVSATGAWSFDQFTGSVASQTANPTTLDLSGPAYVVVIESTFQGAWGDANADLVVNILDALMIADLVVGEISQGDVPGYDRCDVDGNGTVDINDALKIAKFDAGMIPESDLNPTK